jgi:hypothetical protein
MNRATRHLRPSIPEKTASQLIDALKAAPTSGGKTNLLKHYNGDPLTHKQAIIAKCADCMGFYIDGRCDCGMSSCPLYGFQPYRGKKQEVPR